MFRYFALTWDPDNTPQETAARGVVQKLQTSRTAWKKVYGGPGLEVHCVGLRGDGQLSLLEDQSGVVVGTLFERPAAFDGGSLRKGLLPGDSEAVIASEGRRLIERYWGSYIAFLRNPRTETQWVILGPLGTLSCLSAQFRGVTLYFSRMEDCLELELIRFSLSWDRFVAHVALGWTYCREAVIQEVCELKPGECVRRQRDRVSRQFYWNPLEIARSPAGEDPELLAAELRRTAKGVTHTLAACHQRIVHLLSGGLDSSAVLGCLRDAPVRPEITCINDYSDGSNGDERHYAILAAAQANCPMVEHARDTELRLERMGEGARTANPYHNFLHLITNVPAADFARSNAATAIFSGFFADGLFYRSAGLPSAADYLWHHGLRPGVLRAAFDAALRDHLSIWAVLQYGLRYGLTRKPLSYHQVREQLSARSKARKLLISPEISEALTGDDRYIHPLLQSPAQLPPGKIWHASATIFSQADDPFADPDGPELVHPFMAQPFAELCLRIPIYVHQTGGWDRALERRAFRDDLPVEIYQRTTKGGMGEYAKQVMMRNIRFARETLLNGVLAREKIFNRRYLEEALCGEPRKMTAHVGDLMNYLSKELWLQKWGFERLRAAA